MSAWNPHYLARMLHVLRGLFLLFLMGLGQAETAFALHTDHTHCAPQHADEQPTHSQQGPAPQGDTPDRDGTHDGASCAAMPACGIGLGLPAALPVVTPAAQASPVPFTLVITPPCRADTPGNPPPRA